MQKEAEKEIICPTIHHFGVLTGHLEEMIKWYRLVVGMKIIYQSAEGEVGFAFLSFDQAHHRMALIAWPNLQDDHDAGPGLRAKIQHVAFEHSTIDNLLQTWQRLKVCSIEPVMAVDHGMSIAFYYRDPDGNCIELFVDTSEVSTDFMQNARIFGSAIGTYLEPEKLYAAWEAGATLTELHQRAFAGDFPPSQTMDPSMIL